MKPEDYIQKGLTKLQSKEPSAILSEDICRAIFRLLTSKKFRKYAITPGYEEHILSAIKTNVTNNEPIKLTLVFGGYKLWRLEESPEADWAELFSLMYYAKWLKPIAEIYGPGVWLDFYTDDVILELMDNIPKVDTEMYIESFKRVLAFIKTYLPTNLNFTINRVGDQYENYEAFKADLYQSIEKVKQELNGKDLDLTPTQVGLVELNVKLAAGQAEDPKWKEKVFLIHEGYTRVSKRRPYYRTPDKIMLCTRPVTNSLAIGTTKKSVVKFWIGAGILERSGDYYIENIFSPNQLEKNHYVWQDIQIEGLEGKNFQRIRVV